MKQTPLTAITCILLGTAAVSQAAVVVGDIISINLNSGTAATPTGAAVIGQSGDTWNNFNGGGFGTAANGAYGPMITTSGASSGISLALSGGPVKAHGEASSSNLDIFEGGFFLDSGISNATVTFSGFAAGTIIDLYLYAGGYTTGEGAAFTFGGSTLTATNTVDIETVYTLNNNYVKFSGLVANGSGEITGTWTNPNSYSIFNGAQIAIVPEPSAALLGGIGMLALLRRRRA